MVSVDFVSQFREHDGAANISEAVWYIVGATALAAAGAGDQVAILYEVATAGLELEDKKIVQRRIKEAILKGTVLYGVPRSAQALFPLFSKLSDEEIDHYAPRTEALDKAGEAERIAERGRKYFDTLWGPPAGQANRDQILKYQPDLYLLNLKMIYDYWISEDAILSNIETQMCNTAALICSNSPVQAMWHMRGIVRLGGSISDARFAQDIGFAVAKHHGCRTDSIKKVDEIDFKDNKMY